MGKMVKEIKSLEDEVKGDAKQSESNVTVETEEVSRTRSRSLSTISVVIVQKERQP